MSLNKVKHLITDDFLKSFETLASHYGWSGDFTELQSFFDTLRTTIGKPTYQIEILDDGSETNNDQAKLDFRPPHMSFHQIVDHLISSMTPEAKKTWLDVKQNELILGHFSTGMSIRNEYRLWEPDHPAVGKRHPDDVSFEIMKAVWKKLNQPENGFTWPLPNKSESNQS